MARVGITGISRQLVGVGRRFYARGWVLGTSGNFSAVVSREPLRLAITASAVHKGELRPADILLCDQDAVAVGWKKGRPSAEAFLHVEIAKSRAAGAILHTHSIWTTVLSDLYSADGGFAVEGYEMLKGLTGVASHEHREWIPIVSNEQDMSRLIRRPMPSCSSGMGCTPGARRWPMPSDTSKSSNFSSKSSAGR
jgi:methylthioribulose-1-phosphate dehydratase